MNKTVAIPGSWDGFAAIEEIAMREGRAEYAALWAAIENGSWRKHGKGRTLTIEIGSEAEMVALAAEAKYQDEYWNTDLFGVKEAGSSDPVRARAAKALLERVAVAMGEPA